MTSTDLNNRGLENRNYLGWLPMVLVSAMVLGSTVISLASMG